jgi:hypothetical protein
MFHTILIQMIDGKWSSECSWCMNPLALWQTLPLHSHVRCHADGNYHVMGLGEGWVGRWGRDASWVSVPKPCRQSTHEHLWERHSPHWLMVLLLHPDKCRFAPAISIHSSQSTREDDEDNKSSRMSIWFGNWNADAHKIFFVLEFLGLHYLWIVEAHTSWQENGAHGPDINIAKWSPQRGIPSRFWGLTYEELEEYPALAVKISLNFTMYKPHEMWNYLLKSKDSIDHNIKVLNLIKLKLLCICQQKILKRSIVWLKRIYKMDILHAKI